MDHDVYQLKKANFYVLSFFLKKEMRENRESVDNSTAVGRFRKQPVFCEAAVSNQLTNQDGWQWRVPDPIHYTFRSWFARYRMVFWNVEICRKNFRIIKSLNDMKVYSNDGHIGTNMSQELRSFCFACPRFQWGSTNCFEFLNWINCMEIVFRILLPCVPNTTIKVLVCTVSGA